jgi:NAD(P)-dependent dehydrogenase (short-subunit alcohol dehydrogenase family)
LAGAVEETSIEVKPFNIHVSLTEAGFLKTPMIDKRQASAASLKEYDLWRQRAFNALRDHGQKAPGPELVAEALLKIISSKTPRLHYLIGSQAKSSSLLRWCLPEELYEQGNEVLSGWTEMNETSRFAAKQDVASEVASRNW